MMRNYSFVGIEEVMENNGYVIEDVIDMWGEGVVGIICDEDGEYECVVYENGELVEYVVGGVERRYENIKVWMEKKELIEQIWGGGDISVYEYVEEERRMEFMEVGGKITLREEVCVRWDRSKAYGVYEEWFEVFMECFVEWI